MLVAGQLGVQRVVANISFLSDRHCIPFRALHMAVDARRQGRNASDPGHSSFKEVFVGLAVGSIVRDVNCICNFVQDLEKLCVPLFAVADKRACRKLCEQFDKQLELVARIEIHVAAL